MLLILFTIAEPRRTSIVSSFTSDGYVSLSVDNMKFLFDTGANMSLIYADTVPESFFYLRRLAIKDISGNLISAKHIFSFNPNLGIMRGILGSVCLLPRKYQWEEYNGIIGTDLIDKNNWFIDFKKGEIHNDFLPIKKNADMYILYECDNGLYYADFEIEGVDYTHVLIDTGYDRSDFMFRNLHFKQFNDTSLCKEDSCFGVVGNGYPIKIYQNSNNNINGINFSNITYAVSSSHDIIGIPFFRRFSSIVWNTKEHVIECYY